jgi:transketolase
MIHKGMYPISDPKQLEEIARQIRLDIVEMLYRAGSGHVGGSLSATDVLVALFFSHMHLDPGNACYPERDYFVLSKGHAAPVLYAILARLGYIPREDLFTLRQFGSLLQGHPDCKCTPGVEVSTGSLGQGLSVANGIALAMKMDHRSQRVYALMGDGEIQEGQIWEAAMFASFHRMDNLVAIVDYNRIQLDGFVKDILDLEPLADKWRGFGWHVIEVDGHSIPALQKVFAEAETTKGKPTCVLAHTIKGKGVSFMENNPKFHGMAPSPEEFALAMKELQ